MSQPFTPADRRRLVRRYGLTPKQEQAALETARNVAVTAGAGSGKTRTLVARYLPLLAELGSPRAVVAITFTEKAAREMRSRIRAEVRTLVTEAQDDSERAAWQAIESRLDAARISTFHSLCQEILRSHPIETALDPEFGIADENESKVLKQQAAEDALWHAVGEDRFQPLFQGWKAHSLRQVLAALLDRRLDLGQALEPGMLFQRLYDEMDAYIQRDDVQADLEELRAWRASGDMERASTKGDLLAPHVSNILAAVDRLESAFAAGDHWAAAQALGQARKSMVGNVGIKGPIKASVKRLRERYETYLPWLSVENSTELKLSFKEQYRATTNLLLELFACARDRYLEALRQRNRLDFDDLEGLTAALLQEHPEAAARWQNEIRAVLVDEFQDTNARQRSIVTCLVGDQPGRLFVVGDARQSIYRFRGADVRVFRQLQADIEGQGGDVIDLDCTFRTHPNLLAAVNELLQKCMVTPEDPAQLYRVPFSALSAARTAPAAACRAPHVEFILGSADSAAAARPIEAQALCQRLLELKQEGQIARWDQVTLLFRASTGFPSYEDALEAAGIPYVTVAGKGFYNRPEIRDILNLVRALGDPWDDAAMAGLLLSPVIGLSAAGLAVLRGVTQPHPALYSAVTGALPSLEEADQQAVTRARSFLEALLPLVDRIPVADLLTRAMAHTNYRAVLAGSSARLWRNLDKLLTDTQTSGIFSIAEFLEWIQAMRDAGAREGEAVPEEAGAVRLMTIHKAKGLEFDFVVLADGNRKSAGGREDFILLPETGLVCSPDRLEQAAPEFWYARWLEKAQEDAELDRLLYVALTRAREKVLICGHVKPSGTGGTADGWTKQLLEAAGIHPTEVLDKPGEPWQATLSCSESVRVWCCTEPRPARAARQPVSQPASALQAARPLYPPLSGAGLAGSAVEREPDEQVYRVTHTGPDHQGLLVGRIFHRAVQRWTFPGDPQLPDLLHTAAVEHGLLDPRLRSQVLDEVVCLLDRLREHPIWQTLDQAPHRLHEAPYTLPAANGRMEIGYIDVLFGDSSGWTVLDFKTDLVNTEVELRHLTHQYRSQLLGYAQAVRSLLGPVKAVQVCFVNCMGGVTLQAVASAAPSRAGEYAAE